LIDGNDLVDIVAQSDVVPALDNPRVVDLLEAISHS
jgi:hypothetical protein